MTDIVMEYYPKNLPGFFQIVLIEDGSYEAIYTKYNMGEVIGASTDRDACFISIAAKLLQGRS